MLAYPVSSSSPLAACDIGEKTPVPFSRSTETGKRLPSPFLQDEGRSFFGGFGHERLDPRNQVFGLGGHALQDHRVAPELQAALLDERVVLVVGAQMAKPADERGGRIDLKDPAALGEVLVGHFQDSLHLGAQAAIGIHEAAGTVDQSL